MKKLLLFAMLLATVAMTSCSKSSSKPTLVGKWKLTSYVYKVGTFTETYTGLSGDYMDFKSNGIVETNLDGDKTTADYSIEGSNVTVDGLTYSITNLTTSAATLYYAEGSGSNRLETTINLRK